VPLREYDELAPFFERPLYWGMTSGTAGIRKSIPVTRGLLDASKRGMQLAVGGALAARRDVSPLLGKTIYIGASEPLRLRDDGVPSGVITAVAVHDLSPLARASLLPGTALDHVVGWTAKLDALVDMSRHADVRMISGMPPWLLAFAERIERTLGVRELRELWPNLALAVHAGASPEPYREELRARFGPIRFRNVYTATEGFFAFQDTDDDEAGLLPVADDVVFELVPISELRSRRPIRVLLADAEPDIDYALVCSTWAGLFGYVLGDTVRVVSRAPTRIVLSGRVHARLNVTGEQVGASEIEGAMAAASRSLAVAIREAAVVALGPGPHGRAHHVWLVELEERDPRALPPTDLTELARVLDTELAARAPQYRVRRQGDPAPLDPPTIRVVSPGGFRAWLEGSGKIGGQHKVPRVLEAVPDALARAIVREAWPRPR
jgi:acyl-CoA synthetase (AMP-forming)/AMP-acid ligase II